VMVAVVVMTAGMMLGRGVGERGAELPEQAQHDQGAEDAEPALAKAQAGRASHPRRPFCVTLSRSARGVHSIGSLAPGFKFDSPTRKLD
jgi:hypothetical protein